MTLKDPAEFAKLLSHTEVAARSNANGTPGTALRRTHRHPDNRNPRRHQRSRRHRRVRPILRLNKHSKSGVQWRLRCSGPFSCRDNRLSGGDDSFSDRDYSGGSAFSWREREIVFTIDLRTRSGAGEALRVARYKADAGECGGIIEYDRYVHGLSRHLGHRGGWRSAVSRPAGPRTGTARYRLEEDARGRVLLDGRPYTVSRI